MTSQLTISNAFSNRSRRQLSRRFLSGLVLAAGLSAVAPVTAYAHGDYTPAQAKHGAQLYSQHCAQCHGSALQGQTGPALAGSDFKGSLEYSKMSAKQLFNFIAAQMPYNDPGSLKKQQYLDVLAYILSKNGYPAGDESLSESSLSHVKLLPYPGSSQSH